MTAEILVILEPHAGDSTRAAVGQIAPILHSGSDRVFAVIGDVAAARSIQKLPGVLQVLTGEAGGAGLPALDPSELLFVRGWLLNRQPKQRTGEGLAWDTPGFHPPDGE